MVHNGSRARFRITWRRRVLQWGFGKFFGGSMGVVMGIVAGLLLCVAICIGGCTILAGGCTMALSSAAKQAEEAAERQKAAKEAKKHAEIKTGKIIKAAEQVQPAKQVSTEEKTRGVKGPSAKLPEIPAPEPAKAVDEEPKAVASKLRTWTDAETERTIEAEFVSMAGGKVKLKKADGSVVTIPVARLGEADQQWISRRTKDGTSTATTPSLAIAPFDSAKAREYQSLWAKHLDMSAEVTNSIGMKFVLIPPGEFVMGSPDLDSDALQDEKPQHRVRITKPFYLGAHEVTVGQYRQFAEATKHANEEWETAFPAQTDDHPVVSVSWDDAGAFCKWGSAIKKARLTACQPRRSGSVAAAREAWPGTASGTTKANW